MIGMDPSSLAGSILGGLAKVIMAVRGAPAVVEADHFPEQPQLHCANCGRLVAPAQPERIFVRVHALNATQNLRIREAGLCRHIVARKHTIPVVPVGGRLGPNARSEVLQRFGERRSLPATVTADNMLSFNVPMPADLPNGIERGRKLRIWVGKPTLGGARFSESIELPDLAPPEPPKPRSCVVCQNEEFLRRPFSANRPGVNSGAASTRTSPRRRPTA